MPKAPRKPKTPAADAREIELKLLLDPQARESIKALPVVGPALARARPAKLVSVYYDMPDRRLEKAGLTLRLRSDARQHLLTVKTLEARIDRGEWERRIAKSKFTATDIAASPAGAVLGSDTSRLRPIYTSRVTRTRALIAQGSSRIEASLDVGTIEAGTGKVPIAELELELKEGKRSDLLVLARKLAASAPLRLSFIAKSERGQHLLAGDWGKPKRASTPALSAGMAGLDAFLAIARTCLHDFMLNEAAIGNSDDIEGVHQARIAIRRLRAAFSLFAPLIEHPRIEKLAAELKWLSDLLGAARDCDVLMSEFSIDPKSQAGRAIAARRTEARKALADGLASSRMRLLLIDLAGALDAASWSKARARPLSAPVRQAARKLLAQRFKRLLKRARDLEALDAPERHRVRIAAKKLRYMSEFFETVLAGKEAKRRSDELIRQLEKVQKALGLLQDEVTFSRFLIEIVGEAEAERLVAASPVDHKAELHKALKAMVKLAEIKPFWLEWRKG
ncbi:MAG: CHAD domain-containing protein [Hyphomicrobiales bacterium]